MTDKKQSKSEEIDLDDLTESNGLKQMYHKGISHNDIKDENISINNLPKIPNGKKIQDCNESGVVVVRIIVNQMGEVVSAKPGVKGTTNNHPCLLGPAQKTALMHKWYPDSNAPEKQVGFVVIEFKLVE